MPVSHIFRPVFLRQKSVAFHRPGFLTTTFSRIVVAVNLIEQVRLANSLPDRHRARAIRRRSGATQQQVADALGVHVTTVIRWESGERHPRAEVRARYAALLQSLDGAVSE
jgi:DNA-binding XRE family transcriptional regulator